MDDALVQIINWFTFNFRTVLILVVMDDALVLEYRKFERIWFKFVLILVVMDDALVQNLSALRTTKDFVLILVVMDDALVPLC